MLNIALDTRYLPATVIRCSCEHAGGTGRRQGRATTIDSMTHKPASDAALHADPIERIVRQRALLTPEALARAPTVGAETGEQFHYKWLGARRSP